LTISSNLSSSLSFLTPLSPVEDFLKYLNWESRLNKSIAYKWLGMECGERKGDGGISEAIGWLKMSKEGLKDLGGGGVGIKFGGGGDGIEKVRKDRLRLELESVETYLTAYTKVNDSVSL
jgi:hypothetical protein